MNVAVMVISRYTDGDAFDVIEGLGRPGLFHCNKHEIYNAETSPPGSLSPPSLLFAITIKCLPMPSVCE